MKLTHVRHLLTVAERGDLPSSAEQLGVSQHTLTRSIRALERDLGTALFKRGGKRSMTLTPLGAMFVRRASAAQLELERASDEISRHPAASTANVAIGVASGPLVAILPDALRSFHDRFDDVRVRIAEGVFAGLEGAVRDGVLDLYVGPATSHQPAGGLRIERLYHVPRILIGRSGHPLAGATSLEQLVDTRWVATSRLDLDPLVEQHGLSRPVVVVEAETGLGMLSAVASSDVLLVASAEWLPLVERFGLTVLPLGEALGVEPISMVTRSELPLTPVAAHLHDLIVGTKDPGPPVERSPPNTPDQRHRPVGER